LFYVFEFYKIINKEKSMRFLIAKVKFYMRWKVDMKNKKREITKNIKKLRLTLDEWSAIEKKLK